jgi:hypothetical protein
MPKNLRFLFLSLLTTSCGWHLSNEFSQEQQLSISVPYVYGDHDGALTTALVSEIEKQGSFSYAQEGGQFTLNVELVDSRSDNIGFRYDPKKLENGKRKTIPSETRRKVLAKVTVVDSLSQKVCMGPSYILGSTEFDHEYYNLSHNINRFSLGQLTDIDTTYDVVSIPLYRALSRDIAAYLENNVDIIKKNARPQP